jgi:hypothetical protein
MGTHPKTCRAVVITTEGKRYLTPWRGTTHGAMCAARRLAERKNLVVAQIDSILKQKESDNEHAHEDHALHEHLGPHRPHHDGVGRG